MALRPSLGYILRVVVSWVSAAIESARFGPHQAERMILLNAKTCSDCSDKNPASQQV